MTTETDALPVFRNGYAMQAGIFPIHREKERAMNMSECLTLLALIMALSAYIGSVRARMLDRAKQHPSEKGDYIRAAAALMWVDVPLVASGFLLLSYVMVWQLLGIRLDGVLSLALLVFTFAAVVMAVFHACEWCKSLSKWREIKGE